jgi:hypothetical protein
MGNSAITGINLGVPAFQQDFVDGDLTAGVLTVNHNLNSQYVSVTVYNNSNLIIIPDDVTATSTTVSTIDLTSFGTLSGTWRAVIIDKGATVSIIPNTDPPAFVGFHATADGTQTNMAVQTTITVEFPNQTFDVGGDNYNITNWRYTAPITGYYQMYASVQLGDVQNDANNYELSMQGSGIANPIATSISTLGFDQNLALPWTMQMSPIIHMDATDWVSVRIFQNTGTGNLTDVDLGEFSGYLIGV